MVLLVALRCFCFCVRSYLRVGHSFSVTMSNYVVFEPMFKCLKLVFSKMSAHQIKVMRIWIKLSHSRLL